MNLTPKRQREMERLIIQQADPCGQREYARATMRLLRDTPQWRMWEQMRQIEGDDWYPPAEGREGMPCQTAVAQPAAVQPAAVQPARVRKRGRPAAALSVNGDELKRLREGGGYSQEDFAEKCEVSVASIQRGERGGKLSKDTLDKISNVSRQLALATIDDLTLK